MIVYIKFMEVGIPEASARHLLPLPFTTYNMQTRNWTRTGNTITEVDFMYRFFTNIEKDFRLLNMPLNAFIKDGRIYNCHLNTERPGRNPIY